MDLQPRRHPILRRKRRQTRRDRTQLRPRENNGDPTRGRETLPASRRRMVIREANMLTCPCPRILECPHIPRHQKLANILTVRGIRKIQEGFENCIPPRPRGWAHAVYFIDVQCSIHWFSVDTPYDSNSPHNLSSTLHEVGIHDEGIYSKLQAAWEYATRYGR